jgi:hypothetical protein
VSEYGPRQRLRWAVTRLMEAQREALGVCDGALGVREGGFEEDEEAQTMREKERMRAALEDVMAILGAASEDVRGVLGEGSEGTT